MTKMDGCHLGRDPTGVQGALDRTFGWVVRWHYDGMYNVRSHEVDKSGEGEGKQE